MLKATAPSRIFVSIPNVWFLIMKGVCGCVAGVALALVTVINNTLIIISRGDCRVGE